MKQKPKKQLTHWLSVIVVGIALGFAIQFVRAWTEPTQAPPNGNVGAPINTGSQAQTKAGSFTASSLKAGTVEGTTVKGTSQLCIGSDCRDAWPTGGTTRPCTCTMYPSNFWYLTAPETVACAAWWTDPVYGHTYVCTAAGWLER